MKTKTDLFSILGSVQLINGKRQFCSKNKAYFSDCLRNLTLNKELLVTFSEKKNTRSESQLRYYWVIVHYLAEYCGNTDEEMHDALTRLKWGTKTIKLGTQSVEVRRSISNAAGIPKGDMVEQIQFALEKCQEMDVSIPSAESLGYLQSHFQPFTPIVAEKI